MNAHHTDGLLMKHCFRQHFVPKHTQYPSLRYAIGKEYNLNSGQKTSILR